MACCLAMTSTQAPCHWPRGNHFMMRQSSALPCWYPPMCQSSPLLSLVIMGRRDADAAGVAGSLQLSHSTCSRWEPAQRPTMVITNPPWGHRLAGALDHLPELEAAWTDLGLFLKVCAGASLGALSIPNLYCRASATAPPPPLVLPLAHHDAGWCRSRAPVQRGPPGHPKQGTALLSCAPIVVLPAQRDAWVAQERCPEAHAFVLSGNKDVTRHLRMRAARRIPLTVGGTDCRLIEYRVSAARSGGAGHAACELASLGPVALARSTAA